MKQVLAALILIALTQATAHATPTESNGIRILPASAKMSIDGKTDDWDLTGGIFICDDVQTQRDNLAVWMHAQYDAKNLYLLARFKDQSPLNNPGQTLADFGFQGDSLQWRIITNANTQSERGNHFTAWRGVGGSDVIVMEGGKSFDEPGIKDVKTVGAKQAFSVDADGKGYVQEIAVPWDVLTRDGDAPQAGSLLNITFEPNFTVGINGRMSIKDNFQPKLPVDRVFTFQNWRIWGPGILATKAPVAPQPVRLADGREFPVRMENGVPTINWNGLIKVETVPGFKPISFTMPQDGYISLNIKKRAGPSRAPVAQRSVFQQRRTHRQLGRFADTESEIIGRAFADGNLSLERAFSQWNRPATARLGAQRGRGAVGQRPDFQLGRRFWQSDFGCCRCARRLSQLGFGRSGQSDCRHRFRGQRALDEQARRHWRRARFGRR